MSAWVTAGSIAPGVQRRSGSRPSSRARHGPVRVPVTRPGSCTSASKDVGRAGADRDGFRAVGRDDDADGEGDAAGAAADDPAGPGPPTPLPTAHPARTSATAAVSTG